MSAKQPSTVKKSQQAVEYLNIALAGDVGTGTTTLGRNLASTLGWQHVNAGAYFRAWHREHGIPLEQTQDIPEEVDRQLDERFQRDMTKLGSTVFESHLAGWLAKDSSVTFKILCIADQQVAMQRIAAREEWTLDQATQYSILRTQRLNQKFAKLYGVTDPYSPHYFDVVIDTTHMSAGSALDRALREFLSRQMNGRQLARVLDIHI